MKDKTIDAEKLGQVSGGGYNDIPPDAPQPKYEMYQNVSFSDGPDRVITGSIRGRYWNRYEWLYNIVPSSGVCYCISEKDLRA